jgi:hypothetical protein
MNTKILSSFMAACVIGTASAALGADLSVNSRDKHFVRDFAKVSAEVARIGELAQTQSQDPKVRALGQKLTQTYTQAGQQVTAAAQGANVDATSQLTGNVARKVNKLADLSGLAFDRAALKELYESEESGVRQLDLETDNNNSGNASLRQSAAQVQKAIEPVVWQTAELNAQFNGQPRVR